MDGGTFDLQRLIRSRSRISISHKLRLDTRRATSVCSLTAIVPPLLGNKVCLPTRPESRPYAANSRQVVFTSTTDSLTGIEVALLNRETVMGVLRRLESLIAIPVARRFKLKYSFIGEHHPCANKAGVTYRERVNVVRGSSAPVIPQYTYIIRVRVRSRISPQRRMLSFGTHVAILLHELAHLRHMHHGAEFALLLRDIYAYVDDTLHIFKSNDMVNELPSPWNWERRIWDCRGHVDDDELIKLYQVWSKENPAKSLATT
jgi:hypothetical protein